MFKIIKRSISLLLFLSFPLFSTGQVTKVDARTERIDLHNIAKVYVDVTHEVGVQPLLLPNAFDFQLVTHLNIGITYKNVWLDFSLQNTSDKELNLLLAFGSVVNDSLFLFKITEGRLVEETILGEAIPFSARAIQYPTPVFPIHLKANEQVSYFLKASGMGQPMNLTAALLNTEGYHRWDTNKIFFLGLVYGALTLLFLFNVSFYLITKQPIYLIFVGQLLASVLCLLYFDGLINQFVFPNSGYWSNETIAIGLCAVFVFFNFFFSNFFDLKGLAPLAHRVFKYITYSTMGVLVVSFIHPWGFNFFIAFIVGITSVVAVLLLISIFIMRQSGIRSYFFIMLATMSLIVFGSAFQLFTAGLLADTFFTHYAMHLGLLFQSVFLAFGVNDKFRIMQEENVYYQAKLVETMGVYSQNLIANIEAERHRLAVEIHDGLGQNILTIRNTILRGLKQKEISSKVEDTFRTLLDITTDTLEDTRAMSYNLRPPILNAIGLTAAIQSLVDTMRASLDTDIVLTMAESVDGLVAKDLEINIYRILQESFNNASKHARASNIDLTINRKIDAIDIAFQDNGVGYDQNTRINGQGILGIKERVALLKGSLTVTSNAESGTLLFITIPIQK